MRQDAMDIAKYLFRWANKASKALRHKPGEHNVLSGDGGAPLAGGR